MRVQLLDSDGIGRRGFILQAEPDHDSPEKGLSAPETKCFLYIVLVRILSLYLFQFTAVTIASKAIS